MDRKNGQRLYTQDKEHLLNGKKLTDHHINIAQSILKCQFHKLNGLNSMLFQQRQSSQSVCKGIQIIHCRQNHWICVSCKDDTIQIFDSVYSDVDSETFETLQNYLTLLT